MTEVVMTDIDYMKLALREAKRGFYTASPNPAVGCIIVKDGVIVGSGYHHKAGEPHAEVMALRSAQYKVRGATVYVTLEPCSHFGRTPPCAKALCEAGVKRVVIAVKDANPQVAGRGMAMLRKAGIEVECGVCEEEARELNRAFFKGITTGLPYTVLKYGMSLDAKIALSTGESKWITNKRSRSDVQRLRLWADALISTATTVRRDHARMNVRYNELPAKIRRELTEDQIKQPLKVILDSRGTFCGSAESLSSYSIFETGENYLVRGTYKPIVDPKNPNKELRFRVEPWTEHVSVVTVPFAFGTDGQDHTDLEAVLAFLGSKSVRVAMIEAGGQLGAAFFEKGLVDECYCYMSPQILGKQAKDAFAVHEPAFLKDALQFDCLEVKDMKGDLRLTLRPKKSVDKQATDSVTL